MADLSLKMTLTLADTASGPLRAVNDIIDRMQASTAGLSARLDAFAGSMAGIGRSTAAVQEVGAAIGSLEARAAASASGVATLDSAVAALGGALSGLLGRVEAVAAGLGMLSTEARAAGAGIAAGTAELENGAQRMNAMNAQAVTLGSTIKGLGMIWAAFKIEHGLKESIGEAASFQSTQTRMQVMGMSPTEQQDMVRGAVDASRATPQFSQNETLAMAIDLRNATGSVQHALEMLQPFATAAFNMKAATPEGKTFNERDMLLIAKALEQRNATQDPAAMQANLDMFSKIYTATQGRVDANQILGNIQYAKGGLGQSMDLEFMPFFAAMMEQMGRGGSGGNVGQALTTLQASIIGGRGDAAAQKERARLGLIDPDNLVWNSQGNINRGKSDLTMAGASEFQRNPYEWVQNILKPALVRAGIDLTNDAAVNQTLNQIFKDRNAASVAGMMINRGSLIEKDAANINQAKAGDDAKQINAQTAAANIDAFKAQLSNLAIVLGTTLLPTVTAVVGALTHGTEALSAFFTAHPVVATVTAWAAGITSLLLVVAGFVTILGAAGAAMGLWTAGAAVGRAAIAVLVDIVSGGAAVFGVFASGVRAAMTAAIGAVEAGTAAIGGSFLRMVPLIGAALAGWEIGGMIARLQVGGKAIEDWGADVIEWLVNAFTAAANKIGSVLGDTFTAVTHRGMPSNAPAAIDFGNEGGWGGDAPKPAASRPAPTVRPAASGLFEPSTGSGTPGREDHRFAHYDAELDAAKNAYRLEQDELSRHLKTLDEQYQSGLVSVDEFYRQKLATTTEGINRENAALLLERSRYAAQGDRAGVARVDTDITLNNRRSDDAAANVQAEKQAALARLKREAIDLEREAMAASGQRHQAELLHLQEEMDAKTKALVLNGLMSQQDADGYKARTVAALEYQHVYDRIQPLDKQAKDDEQQVRLDEQNGIITQSEAADRLYAIRQRLAAQIKEMLPDLQAYAAASGSDKLKQQTTQLSTDTNRSAAEEDPFTASLKGGVAKAAQQDITGVFRGVLSGSESASKAIKNFGENMRTTFVNLISQRLGDSLYASLFGDGKAGGNTGILGSLFSMLGGAQGPSLAGAAAGAGNAAGAAAGGSSALSGIGSWFSSLMSFDVGTMSVPRDMIAKVHEGEIIAPKYDADGMRKVIAGGGNARPQQITQHFHVPAGTTRDTQTQLGSHAAAGLDRARRRNG